VNGWCSYKTIERWLKSHESYASYSKNVKPGLTEANRVKQVSFAKRVHDRWGLPLHTKILWCMSDEKWWFGLVARTFAKMCPELGVEKKSFSAHHKSHINKVMGHATVGYMFWDNPENGGKGFLIGLHRCQNFKVVARTTNVTTIDPITKKQKRKGNPVKHKLGDVVLVDCNVKGSDIGTPTDPKFALRTLWEEIILPAYDALTAVGGPAEGAVIVHNAPPHQEGDFHAWLVEEFQKRGWRLELQAPQGPYTNVLDLQVKIIMPLHLRLPVTCILSIR
jgi:hypothetical protein